MTPNTQPKILVLLLSGLVFYSTAQADSSKPSGKDDAVLDTVEVVAKPLSKDEKGEAQVYSKNVSNVYVGKEYLERYRIDSAGDILKGLNGVYNMNTRTAGSSITPNIRGIAGKGRIPVTIDGTEQTVDVWLNNYGVGDRNYVDPALFRSIAVEKSPSMTRGVKSGVGGAMSIRTIEADDIVPKGKKWGIELRTSFSGNSTENKNDLRKYMGMDYRDIPGGATGNQDGFGGPFRTRNPPQSITLHHAFPPKHKTTSDNFKLNGDQSYLISGAFKTDLTDGLIAYSYRNKGNYFAGKHGAEDYLHNLNADCFNKGGTRQECLTSKSFIPNMAKMYSPGEEVFNSNVQTKTLLAKNNWHLPNHQKIGWQYMKTNILFGEINPVLNQYVLGYTEANDALMKMPPPAQIPNISSKIETQTKKISYEWKPENNRWIDFSANAWQVKTKSERHQTGAAPLMINGHDDIHDKWLWCNVEGRLPPVYNGSLGIKTCEDLRKSDANELTPIIWDKNTTREEIMKISEKYNELKKPEYMPIDRDSIIKLAKSFGMTDAQLTPKFIKLLTERAIERNHEMFMNSDEKYRVISGSVQATQITRTGFDLSNRFRLRDNLSMTIGADYQREELDEYVERRDSDDLFDMTGVLTGMAAMAGPRAAKRREWGANVLFDWNPTDKLDIQAGIRYSSFRGEDVGLKREREKRNPWFEFGTGRNKYAVGMMLPYFELVGEQEAKDWIALDELWNKTYNSPEYNKLYEKVTKKYGVDKRNIIARTQTGSLYDPTTGENLPFNSKNKAIYRLKEQYIPIHNGKLVSGAVKLAPEMYNKKVSNPQGRKGEYYQYLIGGSGNYNHKGIKLRPLTSENVINSNNGDGWPYWIYSQPITEEQRWAAPPEVRSHAWAPMLAISYRFTDNQRLFARYAQATRFPSLYELTGFSMGGGLIGDLFNPQFDLKPEHSINWEVGYGFNFAPYWSKLRHGDVRLTYYSNTIKNVIDTTEDKRIVQYDKKINTGLEFQSRIDTGKYFASFGATYRLKQRMCDSDTAFAYDIYLRRVPQCIEGGFGASRFYQNMQPQYSLNLDVGTRLLDEKLELGMRGIYHSKVNTKQYDELLQKDISAVYFSTGKPHYWAPSLIFDVYGRYQINKNISMNFGVTNLTDRYYLDPMSNVATPGPGRTFSLGIKGKF